MKTLLVPILIFFASLGYSQEIHHEHSIHHAFVENKGQWLDPILFKSHFDGGNLWVQQNKFVFHLQDYSALQEAHFGQIDGQGKMLQDVVHLNFIGSKKVSQIEKNHRTTAYYNYFIGNDEKRWASDVHGYGEATLKELYEKIDLKLIEQESELKYEFHVRPGGDPNNIVLNYAGQEKLMIDEAGNLVISSIVGNILEQKPYSYQIVNGRIEEVQCDFKLDGDNVTFDLGEYDPYAILVIDPVLIFATYSGSVTDNFGMTATYGYDETAFSGGMIYGNAYPTPDVLAYDISSNFTVPSNPTYGITDAFISHYSQDGTQMIWTTFLGGGDGTQGTETAQSMICDLDNNLYVYGSTSSVDFPIVGGYDNTHNGGDDSLDFYQNGVHFKDQGTDIYVAKISADGHNLLASTFIGGARNDGVNYQDGMPYNTYGIYYAFGNYSGLTTNYGDQFRGEIMLDGSGNCIVASTTKSTDFPTVNPFQAANAGDQDGVIFKFSPDLSTLLSSSYFGGTGRDACYSVKVDSSDNIVVAGGTMSSDLPFVAGGLQTIYGGGSADGFIFKLDPTWNMLQATYFGKAGYDQTFFVEIDRLDNIFVVGQTNGGNFMPYNASFFNINSGQVVAKIDPTLTTLMNLTVFGDGNPKFDISPSAFLVDICGNIYISGWGDHILQSVDLLSNMPITSDAVYSTPPNGFDFYLIVIRQDFSDVLYATYFGEPGSIREHVDGGTSRFDKNGIVYQSVCGACGSSPGGAVTTPGAWSETDLSSNCNNLVFKFDFELIPEAEFTADNTLGCASFEVTFDNFSTSSDAYLWDFGNGDTTSVIFEPTIIYDSAGVYDVYLYVTDSICLLTDTAYIQIIVTDSLELDVTIDQELCQPVPIDFIAYTNGTATEFVWSSMSDFSDTLNVNLADSVLTATPQGPGVYYVQVSNAGCSLFDSVVVDFIGSSLLLQANDSICAGESTLITASSTNPDVTFDNFIWEPDSILVTPSSSNTALVQPNVTQDVIVTATSNNGCVVQDTITIYVGNTEGWNPEASAISYLIPEGDTVTLLGNPDGLSYFWSNGQYLNNENLQNPLATLDETTEFLLTVSDGICSLTDTVLVEVYPFICEDPYLFIPNAFSPNGDGENDVLYVRGAMIKEMTFRIYDRWGEMVFESFDRGTGWDGTFRGKMMDPDVYDYYLKVICIDDAESIIKGNITLLK